MQAIRDHRRLATGGVEAATVSVQTHDEGNYISCQHCGDMVREPRRLYENNGRFEMVSLRWPNVPGVYFVRVGDLLKIGKADNVRKRLSGLQTGSPLKLELLAVAPGGLPEEVYFHESFAAHRRRGEWFELCPPIIREIVRLRGGA